jgi:hypothetical protein
MVERPILSARGAGGVDPDRARSIRKHCEVRLGQMKSIRSDYEDEIRQIARFAQPARSRFLHNTKDQNNGRRRVWNKTLSDPTGSKPSAR